MKTVAIALLLAAAPAAADTDVSGFVTSGTGELSGVVTDRDGKPLKNVKVHIAPKGVPEQVVVTDALGRYRTKLASNDATYVYVEGKVRIGGQIAANVQEGDAEAIEIREALPAAVQPKAKTAQDYVPDYSETAEDKNMWTRAWLLLDVNDAGKVTRVKLLDAPGLDLDKIAVREGFDVKFDPARDRSGRKIPAMVLWTWEWPAYYWMLDHRKSIHRMPPEVSKERCGPGPGPSRSTRDCSKPTVSNAVSRPWIDKP